MEEIVVKEEEESLVQNILLIGANDAPAKQVLIPDNQAEIFIPLNGNLSFKALGSAKSKTMLEGKGYFLMPRGRGTEVTMDYGCECLLIKINPMYAYGISKGLTEAFRGAFELEFTQSIIRSLNSSFGKQNMPEIENILLEYFEGKISFYDYNSTIVDSIDKIRNSFGTISVKEIYSSLNVSKSKLEQHFNREIGLTPKEYCRIEKINHFIKTYTDNCDQSLTEITYLCGYYDQSHLIKDFKYFLETSPKRFFNQREELLCYQ